MPKNTTKKNTKGKKAAASKKVEVKKAPVKKVETKKVPAKKVEVKVTEKKVKEVAKVKKGKMKAVVTNVMNNTPFVIALCAVVLLVAALIFVLCVKRVPTTSKGEEILATVNGKTVTADDLYLALKDSYGTDTLVNLIDTYIADKEVEVTKENEEYVQEVVDYYKEYAEYYKVDLATFLASYVGLNGITTEKEFYNYVLEDYKKTLVVTNYIAENAKDEDLKEYYKENYSDKLTVKHILIEIDSEAEDKDEAKEEAYDKAMDIIEELNDTSSKKLDKKFEELAEDNSDDTATYSKGGLIEDFSKKDVVEEFWNASEKLKDGEYTTEPVKSTYGYHVILKVGSTPVEKYKDIKNEVKTAYAESLISSDSTLFAKKWDEIRKQYKLSIKDDFIKEAYKKTVEESTKKTEEN
ncbi:MAG: peptidylprolyl isomerase [Bacilli bacterium]|nr:peptidylprolyl isomerase [Bacilli bacterium]